MNKLESFVASHPFGFITADEVPALIALDRLHPLFVRCGMCRFTCAAQDLEHLKRCIVAGGDYVRDVAMPPDSLERAAKWTDPDRQKHPNPAPMARPADQKPGAWHLNRRARQDFNENDCSGVFDGHRVTSDADSGL